MKYVHWFTCCMHHSCRYIHVSISFVYLDCITQWQLPVLFPCSLLFAVGLVSNPACLFIFTHGEGHCLCKNGRRSGNWAWHSTGTAWYAAAMLTESSSDCAAPHCHITSIPCTRSYGGRRVCTSYRRGSVKGSHEAKVAHLKPEQIAVIKAFVSRQDVFAALPTGYRKSVSRFYLHVRSIVSCKKAYIHMY